MKRETKDMSNLERCQNMTPRLRFYLDAVFGVNSKREPNCTVEVNTDNGEPVVLVDGWLEAMPGWGIADKAGQTLVPDEPTWSLCEIRHIPQTRWEPEDVDIYDIGEFRSRCLIDTMIARVMAARLNNAAMCEQENEQAEAEKELHG